LWADSGRNGERIFPWIPRGAFPREEPLGFRMTAARAW
jgi:hypothetical protein